MHYYLCSCVLVYDCLDERNWHYASAASVSVFVCYQVLIGVDNYFSKYPLCDAKVEYANWVWYSNFAHAGGFSTTCLLILIKLARVYRQENGPRSSYIASLCVVSMALISSLLTLILDWGGACEDMFGYWYYSYVLQ